MRLSFKLFLPVALLFMILAACMHFYWLPNYIKLDIESLKTNEQDFISLLSTTLVPDLLANDLAKTHATLDQLLDTREHWHHIKLYDYTQILIYPLDDKIIADDNNLVLLQSDISFDETNIARLAVWIDLEGLSAERINNFYQLEQLLFFTLFIATLITTLMQDRWIRSPLRQLSLYTSNIAVGRYDTSINYQSSDEIGTLIAAFDSMREQVRQREDDLIESQERNVAVIENAIDGIITIDELGVVMSYNPASEKIFGYTSAEVIGQNIKILMPEPYHSEHDNYLKNYMTSGDKKIIGIGREVEGLKKDGSKFPLELSVSEVKLKNRRLFIGMIRDITDRKKSEAQRARYANALEKLHNITSNINSDFEHKIQDLLELGCELFDMPLGIISRIEGQDYIVEHIVGPPGAPQTGSEFELGNTYCVHTLKTNSTTAFEFVKNSSICDHPCYKSFALEAYIGTPVIVNGEPYGTLNFSNPEPHDGIFDSGDYNLIQLFAQWVGNEISRVESESKLYDSNALRQAIMDSANFSIISTDVSGKLLIFSKGAERMLGYTAAEVVGRENPAFLHDLDEVVSRTETLSKEVGRPIEPGFDTFITRARAGIADEQEWTYIRKDGSRFPVLLSITAVCNANGVIIGYLGIGSDLTERKKIDKLQSEFISTVSHELRTPLTSIRGAIGLVLGMATDMLPGKLLRMLETANRNSERLTYLINDILDLEKINSGKLELQLEAAILEDLAQRSIDENEGYAHTHNITLKFHIDGETKTTVRIDEQRILQAFANLISNAVKFSPENGVVEIVIKRDQAKVRASIIDHGEGIPYEFRPRIFGRFAQADSSDTREKGGTGLGLTITKGIIEQHGGLIDFNSTTGEGTEFFFELPVWDQIIENDSAQDDAPKVLICEDDSDVAYVLVNLMEQEGLSGDIAATAQSARDLLLKNNYDVLLLDLILPDAYGLDLVRELRDNDATRTLPIIIISGHADEGRIEFNGDAVTVADWLQKPIDQKRLSSAITDALHVDHLSHILHVEDNLDIIQVTQALFEEDVVYDYATTLASASQKISENKYDLIILDISLPDGSGLELLDQIGSTCPIVLFSGTEPRLEINERVAATLTKSKTSNSDLIRTVKQLIHQKT